MDVLYVVGTVSICRHNELRYSLRSVARNFPHDRVIVAGHCPSWLQGTSCVPGKDTPRNRHKGIQGKILKALESGKVGERFALFCDDFYILQPWTSDDMRYVGKLKERVRKAKSTRSPNDPWRKAIEATLAVCADMGLDDPLDFGSHHPFVMERDKAIKALRFSLDLPVQVDINTLYCAMFGGDVEFVANAKGRRWKSPPSRAVYSSGPEVERCKHFWAWLEAEFPDPCRYER